ncbi:MAG: RIP metalloprotease RseP [Erysipelotrichaceae bacterium]|mgnify:FL=1|jgi:regulator of sigma E protease|nr:RIP metalloprotease RseP [Bacillota bacterium]
MGIIYFILLMSVIIIMHELGHLITAKIFNVYCYEFSLGMGPKLISKKWNETVYSIRALPIGGFVAMAGEDEDDRGIVVPYERTIKGIDKWKQIIIMLAGVFMNFMLAWIVMSSVFLAEKVYVESPKPIVAGVMENSPAESAGFMEGDYIVKVTLNDGTVIKPDNFYDILPFTQMEKDEITYTILRGEETLEFKVTPKFYEEDNVYLVGILIPPGEIVEINLLNAFKYGASYLSDITKALFISLVRLLSGKGLDQLSGPVGIYTVTKETASLGISNFMMLIAVFSLNVGIFNLLPLPILDGGRALITLFEWITDKQLNKTIETVIMTIGWLLMISLMVFATWQDISRLF